MGVMAVLIHLICSSEPAAEVSVIGFVLLELTDTGNICSVLVPHPLLAFTVTLEMPLLDPIVTVIAVVPPPEVIVQPAGTVQLYVLAFNTLEMLYTWLVRLVHCVVSPAIARGDKGAPGLTAV